MEENSANDMFSFAAKYFRQDMEPGTIPSGQGKVVPKCIFIALLRRIEIENGHWGGRAGCIVKNWRTGELAST